MLRSCPGDHAASALLHRWHLSRARGAPGAPGAVSVEMSTLFDREDPMEGAPRGYIVTDGVLLGSYKFGGMLDWDADVVRGSEDATVKSCCMG